MSRMTGLLGLECFLADVKSSVNRPRTFTLGMVKKKKIITNYIVLIPEDKKLDFDKCYLQAFIGIHSLNDEIQTNTIKNVC